MLEQKNKLNFEGRNIYVGIDVHLRQWNVSIYVEELFHKTFQQPAEPMALSHYLRQNFPGGQYHSAYEAGFCGFWAHHKLKELGIDNIVIHPADVPTTQKEKVQKTDAVDSRKIGRSLQKGELKAIRVPTKETYEDKSLLRARKSLVKALSKSKNQVKSMLYLFGIRMPERYMRTSAWTRNFSRWLKEEAIKGFSQESGRESLLLTVEKVERLRALLLRANRDLRELEKSDLYRHRMELLRGIPGIGLITGLTFLLEIEDIGSFNDTDQLAGFAGLVPKCHGSGDEEGKGEMTFRGQNNLRIELIESSRISVGRDPALGMAYLNYCKRMDANKAIIRIARKLLNRIYYVLSKDRKYETCVVK
jgi:transposase